MPIYNFHYYYVSMQDSGISEVKRRLQEPLKILFWHLQSYGIACAVELKTQVLVLSDLSCLSY